ncbi:hypothetical protein PPL_12382 [Heterostelium album PN500]|uniref:COI1 F-box domain-containing protein n=1 Tax=Heterostelium pallidum (strain ATCC 26659 / Pp 5 / PN500) TaxID=670386 RepID=D3BMG2_HETP5|nr:hypothetical protein PPL_12382 [Heterostelium album PN500]EFA77174.1 hypothetical protein PPL_12382 [Heterostelium album PN500]|eukprot:XP_020429303.1 hypothetical protein PPL_12382 [Heterostelium album PN500]
MTSVIVGFSHLLLSKITGYLDDNVDRICFSLVCKRWFHDRDSYLMFNTDELKLKYSYCKRFYLRSYQSIYEKSLKQVKESSLYINEHDSISAIHDYSFTIGIYQATNIRKMIGCTTLEYGLPPNLTHLSFSQNFNEPLFQGCFPSSLKKIKFNLGFSQSIPPDVLPSQLEKLVIDNDQVTIEPGLFPSSLTILKLPSTEHTLQPGSIPPNLEYLEITIKTVPTTWIPAIRYLSNLTTLLFFNARSSAVGNVDLSQLPPTLTTLRFHSVYNLTSAVHPSIKQLDISFCNYDINEIFPTSNKYHFHQLSTTLPHDNSKAWKRLKIDKLVVCSLSPQKPIHSIPKGILTLDVRHRLNLKDPKLPNSIQKLKLTYPSYITETSNCSVPNNVRIMKIVDILSKKPTLAIPKSVRTIYLSTMSNSKLDWLQNQKVGSISLYYIW